MELCMIMYSEQYDNQDEPEFDHYFLLTNLGGRRGVVKGLWGFVSIGSAKGFSKAGSNNPCFISKLHVSL